MPQATEPMTREKLLGETQCGSVFHRTEEFADKPCPNCSPLSATEVVAWLAGLMRTDCGHFSSDLAHEPCRRFLALSVECFCTRFDDYLDQSCDTCYDVRRVPITFTDPRAYTGFLVAAAKAAGWHVVYINKQWSIWKEGTVVGAKGIEADHQNLHTALGLAEVATKGAQ